MPRPAILRVLQLFPYACMTVAAAPSADVIDSGSVWPMDATASIEYVSSGNDRIAPELQ